MDVGEPGGQRRQRLGLADPGHHVLALGVEQEVTVGGPFAGGRVAGEAHSGPRVIVAVAEHHGLHVHRSAQVIGDVLAGPVGHSPGPVPRMEHGLDRHAQLPDGVLRKRLARLGQHHLLVARHQVPQQLGGDLGVHGHPSQALGVLEQAIEQGAVDIEDDPPEHGHEPAVRVEGEPLAAGLGGQSPDGLVVEAKVQDGVHHARHGELRPRPDADQQWIARIAQATAHRLLDAAHVLGDLVIERHGPPTGAQMLAASLGGDGEARRHRQVEHRGHLGQIRPLPAQEILEVHRRRLVRMIEGVDQGHGDGVPGSGIGARRHCRARPDDHGRARRPTLPLATTHSNPPIRRVTGRNRSRAERSRFGSTVDAVQPNGGRVCRSQCALPGHEDHSPHLRWVGPLPCHPTFHPTKRPPGGGRGQWESRSATQPADRSLISMPWISASGPTDATTDPIPRTRPDHDQPTLRTRQRDPASATQPSDRSLISMPWISASGPTDATTDPIPRPRMGDDPPTLPTGQGDPAAATQPAEKCSTIFMPSISALGPTDATADSIPRPRTGDDPPTTLRTRQRDPSTATAGHISRDVDLVLIPTDKREPPAERDQLELVAALHLRMNRPPAGRGQ